MKESVGSLRAFFIIFGLLGAGVNALAVVGSGAILAALAAAGKSPMLGVFLMVICGLGALLGLAYLFCGIMLPSLLQTSPMLVCMVLYANIGLQLLALVGGYAFGTGTGGAGTLLGFGISLYLLRSVRRLAGMG